VTSAATMSAEEAGGSVAVCIRSLKVGDEAAARSLWQRYFGRLVRLARGRLGTAPRRASHEEDIAISAFYRLCHGITAGRFPNLVNRDHLWRLLVTIAAQKVVDHRRHSARAKRGGARTVGAADLTRDGTEYDVLLQVARHEPSPDVAAATDEGYRCPLDQLADQELRRIAIWKFEGYENAEIARRLDCSLRTVERKLGAIRDAWLAKDLA
jgi:DNA-directed RNA polymerase specialized sigma24 family protein